MAKVERETDLVPGVPQRRASLRRLSRGGPVREAAVDVAEQAALAGFFLLVGMGILVAAVGHVVVVASAVHLLSLVWCLAARI
jgi:hypothetical protein